MRNTILGSVCFLFLAAGCSESVVSVKNDYANALAAGDDFAALPQQLVMGSTGVATAASDDQNFYLAIKKSSLSSKWFLSSFLTQTAPVNANNIPVTSLDTKIVSFKVQNGKLYVFDVDNSRAWSDSLSPEVIVDAYPIVTSAAFDKINGSADYVLVDPSAGLNKYTAYSDQLAGNYSVHFTVDLVYSKRFNKYSDGVSFDQVFTGHSDLGDTSGTVFTPENQFTGSGTVTLSLRKYKESPDFVPAPMVGVSGGGAFYFGSKPELVKNDGSWTQSAVKWSLKDGQPAKKWVISRNILDFAKDPALKDYDVVGAMKRGIEQWNTVLGYDAFAVDIASTTDTVGDEDKSFLFIDENPSAGFAFANWRSNPDTGEIRAASIYFSSVWFLAALQAGDDLGDATAPNQLAVAPTKAELKAMTREQMKAALTQNRGGTVANKAISLAWNGSTRQQTCQMRADEAMQRMKIAATVRKAKGEKLNLGLSKKDIVERYLTHIVMHEVGHTLGLRHNFKGSLAGTPAASVMDYLDDTDTALLATPGPYDIAAVQYLYGLSTAKPTQQFCNDGYVTVDAECNVFDFGSDPYNTSAKPWYLDIVDNGDIFAFFFGMDAEMHSFARGSKKAAVRADAFDTLMKPARAIDPALLADDPFWGIWYDLLGEIALEESYLSTPDTLNAFGIRITTPLAASTQAATIVNCSNIIMNSDKIRTISSRSTCVTILDKFHTDAALTALKTVRADLDKPENQLPSTAPVADKAQFESLKAKIDKVTLGWVK